MPGRCSNCNYLCNPDPVGCPIKGEPCPRNVVRYCGQQCQEQDWTRHKGTHHPHQADTKSEQEEEMMEQVQQQQQQQQQHNMYEFAANLEEPKRAPSPPPPQPPAPPNSLPAPSPAFTPPNPNYVLHRLPGADPGVHPYAHAAGAYPAQIPLLPPQQHFGYHPYYQAPPQQPGVYHPQPPGGFILMPNPHYYPAPPGAYPPPGAFIPVPFPSFMPPPQQYFPQIHSAEESSRNNNASFSSTGDANASADADSSVNRSARSDDYVIEIPDQSIEEYEDYMSIIKEKLKEEESFEGEEGLVQPEEAEEANADEQSVPADNLAENDDEMEEEAATEVPSFASIVKEESSSTQIKGIIPLKKESHIPKPKSPKVAAVIKPVSAKGKSVKASDPKPEAKKSKDVKEIEEKKQEPVIVEAPKPRALTRKEKNKLERARLQAKMKQEKKAKKEEQEALKVKGGYEEAVGLFESGEHLKAAVSFGKLIKDPNCSDEPSDLYFYSSKSHQALGKAKRAREDALKAVELKASHDKLFHAAKLELAFGNFKESERLLQGCDEAVEVDGLRSQFPIIQDLATDAKRAQADEDWNRLKIIVDMATDFCPSDGDMRCLKIETYLHLNLLQDARDMLRKHRLELQECKRFGYVRALELYFTTNWWEEEKQVPEVLEKLRRSDPASKVCERAANIKTSYKNVQLLMKKGDSKEARKLLTDSLVVDASNKRYMAEIYYDLFNLEETDDGRLLHLDKSIHYLPTVKAFLKRGFLFRSKLKYDEALSDFEEAVRLDPRDPESRNLLETTRRFARTRGNREGRKKVRNDYYAILGVGAGATADEIKSAFLKKNQELRPENHLNASADEKAALDERRRCVNKAYKVLRDPRNRKEYDRQQKRSTSSDVDSEFSEEDYECYDSEEDEEEEEKEDDKRGAQAVQESSSSMEELLQMFLTKGQGGNGPGDNSAAPKGAEAKSTSPKASTSKRSSRR